MRQTLSDCTASLSHFHGCTTQQQQVMNAENAQRMAIAAETHAHCVAMFTEAFSRSHCSALASAELCARRGLAEAENRAFAELVLSTGLTKSAELGMRRALNTVRTALQKQQTCTTAMQEALDAQQGLRQLCEAEALSRMNIISAEGLPVYGPALLIRTTWRLLMVRIPIVSDTVPAPQLTGGMGKFWTGDRASFSTAKVAREIFSGGNQYLFLASISVRPSFGQIWCSGWFLACTCCLLGAGRQAVVASEMPHV